MNIDLGLECASCGTNDGVYVVCHHCGKPLCENLTECRFELEDDAFADIKSSPIIAIHCRDCSKTFHSTLRPRRLGIRK